MARYEVSAKGAEALQQLAIALSSAYGGLLRSGEELERAISSLEKKDSELHNDITVKVRKITSRVKMEEDTFRLLVTNLLTLSNTISEYLCRFSSPTTAKSYPNTNGVADSGGYQSTNSAVEDYQNSSGFDSASLKESAAEKSIVDGFQRELFESKTIELVNPPGGQYQTWVSARDILGLFHDNTELRPDTFWAHHGETKERYASLASKLGTVKGMVDQGISLEEIKQNPDLTACVEQYFSPDQAVRVYQYGDKYIFNADGRHRVRIAQELGIDIPVSIYKVVKKR